MNHWPSNLIGKYIEDKEQLLNDHKENEWVKTYQYPRQ
jgi:hypothetical protein